VELSKRKNKQDSNEPRKIKINSKAGAQAPEEERLDEEQEAVAEETVKEEADAAVEEENAGAGADEIEELRKQAAEANDKYLRLYAETENFKKRMAREAEEMRKYHNEGLIMELLPVVDNLERAISHAEENGDSGGLIEGVKMVHKQFLDGLGKFGVKHIPAEKGASFDPNHHQAMMQVETDEQDEGTIVDEFQKGYLLNDRVIRATMVTVAKKPG